MKTKERSCLYINMNSFKFKGTLRSKRLVLLVASAAIIGILGNTKVYASPTVDRYGGMDRYETSAKVCDAGWSTNTDYAVLVNGDDYHDALSAAPLAKKYNAPILLTNTEVLNPYTSSELIRLNVKNVFIVGGKGVVSQSIEDSLVAKGMKVVRVGGKDRYETALQVAAKIGKTSEIALVNGNDFRDGMTIASIAALKGMPIILTDGENMPASVKKYLGNTSKMAQIYVVGDANTISDNVISGLSNVKRIGSGGNVYARNVSIIQAFQNEVNTGTLYIASAKNFPDSLSASALAPKTSSPVLFVDSPMDEATSNFLKTHIVNSLKILGGTGSVSYDSETSVENMTLGVSGTDAINDTIWQGEKYTPRATMVITATDGTKKEVAIDWNLSQVNTANPGTYTFTGKLKGTDTTVYATLTVKPLPYKIEDLTQTAVSRTSFGLPTTVSAQMTDGTTTDVPVLWDYGTQSGNKPGVYVFYGTVDKYSKKVKLTLTTIDNGTGKTIKTINNIKATVTTKSSYVFPTTVSAIMTDGSTQSLSVTWANEIKYSTGVYTYEGTVSGYSKKVGLMLIVTGEGGTDPNDPNYPTNPSDPNVMDLGELEPIMQDEKYPTTVKDPTTGKQVPVTWTDAVSIDSTFLDNQYLDDCRVAKFTLNGTISGNKKVRATIGIIPKIITLNVDGKTSNVPAVSINIKKSDYPNGVFNMSELSTRINAVINGPNGIREAKNVHVLLWDPPVVDISDASTYYVTATIEHYSTPVTVTIKIEN
ncbi:MULTISPECIES: cell wall-binding repeat-containing protein [Clostridium]|uniref:N-acetylmuramoyl-L-alanine amidase LytC n=3 Tax=Clostridiaceae TaxID=31979 RepID=D8GQF1_CLOLD|nr:MULTISPECIES: cell wall-binding repeat-containing protein [Clostridium]ADK14074.1 predicted surface-layer protein [Clostridium ljungdahlii DSM 13528]OAA86248.1 N-acetylmuramoyl-L-alanine amidase LytC precursor [Clostridium ljungdahlii DSM 13528]OAA86466.1 N-acetylmuramoyl-L-alanine amidase LytC precursor [Clostridium coskatii]OBR92098.1 N-acetylmuramoyl-L-alanine amidase LytC precursor [Clostridium coskatii]